MPRVQRWLWYGLLIELAKPLVGLADSTCSAAHGIYSDMVAHYNWLRSQENFAASVAYDLEQLPEA